MDNCCCGRPIALRGPRKAVRGKCERGQGSANVGAEVQTWTGRVRKAMRAMGARRGRLSAPWPRFHGVDRADVYIIIHVRACCCGECELNPPPSPPIPRRRSSLTPPHSDTPFPSTSAPPRSPDARPQAARCIPRRPYHPFPAKALRSPPHSDTPFPSTSAPPRSPDPHPQAARCIPHRPHNSFPAAPRCLSFRSASGTKKRHRTVHVRCRMSRSTVVAVGHLGW